MAFTLKITPKGLFKKKLDFEKLVNSCGMAYGHMNDFYVLDDGMQNGVAVIYNPKRIGRGISFDGSNPNELELRYNIPTTETEICDFLRLVKEIVRQLGKARLYCVEEEREYTPEMLEQRKDAMLHFSCEKLNEFCSNKDYPTYILTLAKYPLWLTVEMTEKFAVCKDLKEFEQILHEKQDIDVYYAKPMLMRKKTGEIGAFYVFTETCKSIFPVGFDDIIFLEQIKINEGFVRYALISENKIIEKLFDYNKFIQYHLKRGAEYFDKNHIIVPSMNYQQMFELVQKTGMDKE